MKPSAPMMTQSRGRSGAAPSRRPAHTAAAMKNGNEKIIRSASSVTGSVT